MTPPRTYYTNQARHAYFCTCGKVVHGNGGRAGHFYMHEQRNDGHRETTRTRYFELFPLTGEGAKA